MIKTTKDFVYSIFKADWPAALGWVLTFVIFWRYVGISFCEVIFHLIGHEDVVMLRSDSSHIFALVTTMISMAGMKTYERVKGVTGTSGETKIIQKVEDNK